MNETGTAIPALSAARGAIGTDYSTNESPNGPSGTQRPNSNEVANA